MNEPVADREMTLRYAQWKYPPAEERNPRLRAQHQTNNDEVKR
jgi:hypothetical protein